MGTFVDGRDIMTVDPVELRRGMGYVIQNVGLFPHRTIEENVATVAELVWLAAQRRRERARDLLELVGLDPPCTVRDTRINSPADNVSE